MNKVMQEKLSKVQEVADTTGATLCTALLRDIVGGGDDRAYCVHDIHRRLRGYMFWKHYATFRDEFVTLRNKIGVGTETQGSKVFILKPDGVLDFMERKRILDAAETRGTDVSAFWGRIGRAMIAGNMPL
jgi:hypothetical protein